MEHIMIDNAIKTLEILRQLDTGFRMHVSAITEVLTNHIKDNPQADNTQLESLLKANQCHYDNLSMYKGL